MAIGIQYYGRGTRGVTPARINNPTLNNPMLLGDDPTGGSDDGDLGLTGTASTAGAGSLLNAQTNAAKFKAEQAAAADALIRQQTGAQNQANYLRGLLGAGVPASITGEIGAQETAGRSYINTQAQNLLERLSGALTTGQGATTQGYDTLRNYLQANPATAYANTAQAAPTVTQNTLAQYMQAMGTPTGTVDPALAEVNAQAVGGANAYNQLLNVLRGSEASGQASRLSEEQMARALAGSQLQSIYGSGRANVESEQLAALNALAAQISNARIAAQQAQTSQETAIQNALATLYGTGLITPPPVVTENPVVDTVVPVVPTAPVQSAPVARLAQQVANAKNQTLVNRANAFIEANPTASAAVVAKAFPSLSAAAKKKK
jgi:hypothetical protein